eukprot:gene5042-34831_t
MNGCGKGSYWANKSKACSISPITRCLLSSAPLQHVCTAGRQAGAPGRQAGPCRAVSDEWTPFERGMRTLYRNPSSLIGWDVVTTSGELVGTITEIPLDARFLPYLDLESEELYLQCPTGFLDLGRRSMFLELLKQELPPYACLAREAPGRAEELRMPSMQKLKEAGRRDLCDIIQKCGGLLEVALELGWQSSRRPAGFWEIPENLDREIRKYIAQQWVEFGTPASGGSFFYNQVSGRISQRPPKGLVGLETFKEHPKDRVMPSVGLLQSDGRYDLHHAIVQNGGYQEVAEALGRSLASDSRKSQFESIEDVAKEVLDLALKGASGKAVQGSDSKAGSNKGQPVKLFQPTELELLDAGRADLVYAIHKHGGYSLLSQHTGLQTRKRPRKHWRDINNVVAEIMAYMDSVHGQASQGDSSEGNKSGSSAEEEAAGNGDGHGEVKTVFPNNTAAAHSRGLVNRGSKLDADAARGEGYVDAEAKTVSPSNKAAAHSRGLVNRGSKLDSEEDGRDETVFPNSKAAARSTGLETADSISDAKVDGGVKTVFPNNLAGSHSTELKAGAQSTGLKAGNSISDIDIDFSEEEAYMTWSYEMLHWAVLGCCVGLSDARSGFWIISCLGAEDKLATAHSADLEEAGCEGVEVTDKRKYLPTHQELIRAARQDLLYALQFHGHEKVAQRCNLLVRKHAQGERKPRKPKGNTTKLSLGMIREALQSSGMGLGCTLTDIHNSLLSSGASVNKSRLSSWLTQRSREGEVQKVGHGVRSTEGEVQKVGHGVYTVPCAPSISVSETEASWRALFHQHDQAQHGG